MGRKRGNGRRMRFWRDRWYGDSPLSVSFPSLFALAIDKETKVEEAKSFLGWLHGKKVCGDVEDKVFWTETKSRKFSVKSLYNALEQGNPSLFPSSCIWNM
ncbi:hypothetical protein CK203_023540 [Vitis vinifera]|uniref:Uncharacterized protein n=1 Tax=Vitis vinifera TaxID=29760 RepID=A0A438JC44_VITVI|nr:hypothetical protein CK203_023540 [Vitis vinifera]